MASPLSGSLAKTIGSAFKNLFLDATLTRDVAVVSPDPADPLPPTTARYVCKAIRADYGVTYRSGGLVNEGDVRITILQTSLATTPIAGDRIEIAGMGGPWTIVANGEGQPGVQADPANCTWDIRASA